MIRPRFFSAFKCLVSGNCLGGGAMRAILFPRAKHDCACPESRLPVGADDWKRQLMPLSEVFNCRTLNTAGPFFLLLS